LENQRSQHLLKKNLVIASFKEEMEYSNIIKQQEALSKKVVAKNTFQVIKSICGVDVSYKNNMAFASAVILERKNFEQLELVNKKVSVKQPYVPGLLFLREAEPVLSTLKLLKNDFDLLLVDGHGQLHPRKCGLASYLGLILNKPTIGVAKRLLCGQRKDNLVTYNGKILGTVVETKPNKKVFVSVGHKISLKTATEIVQELIKENEWLPEPLRLADYYSKQQKFEV
jgi:deoxyribonuclease V